MTNYDNDPKETEEWLESLRAVIAHEGVARAEYLIHTLAESLGATAFTATTPYVNTIPVDQEPEYPGNYELERKLKSIIRWNAMAMVVRANQEAPGIGGHISTYASAATLYEVGFNHFFRGRTDKQFGDIVYFQGHASPGIYARAYLEGRLSDAQLQNFRRELAEGGGLSSYPHPYLMPEFWQFPTVSMGLGPIMAIYQARFNRYLAHRGLLDTRETKIWCFVGDGETDEPESLGALTLASREALDNLIFVVNCNLQRLDGPVRGNGKIIQELEAIFRGAGWNVIKVIWGGDWDPLLRADESGLLVKRMSEALDGDYQKYVVETGAYIREHFFGKYPELLKLVEHLSDDQLRKLARGGHDSRKVYAAYLKAMKANGRPTVILAKTIKGYGLGKLGEGRNITHAQKSLSPEGLKSFRDRFAIPISDDDLVKMPFYKPPDNSPEMRYFKDCRKKLGGSLPKRQVTARPLRVPSLYDLRELTNGSGERAVSTTMGFVKLLSELMHHKEIGQRIVPIIPDEARTFGLESLFSQYAIYSVKGQLYEPVDKGGLLFYHESQKGQILEEGITEAGAMSSFIAAGTSYATIDLPMIPFYIFYSMFGFQRVGDLIWAAADMRTKGFLLGATAGRTTLNGEGLQHEDGHSQLVASTVPNLVSYDPAFVYELTVIVQDGLRRMYQEGEEIFYYLTLYNENYPQLPMPRGKEIVEGILRGMYCLEKSSFAAAAEAHLLASGPMLREALKAKAILEEKKIATEVWSVTSFSELRRDTRHIERCLQGKKGVFVLASDYVKLVSEQIAPWIPGDWVSLGTDGFGRSDTRPALRRFFKVDAEAMVEAVLKKL